MITLSLALLLVGAVGLVSAQELDVTGTWVFDVTTGQGRGTPTVTLVQDDESLTGHYSSANLGEADLTGSVRGSDLRFTFETNLQGQALTVTYEGTVASEDSIEGTIGIRGFAQGTFTARRR